MKKVFTNLAVAAMALGAFSAQAESAKLFITTYNTGYNDYELDTEIVRLEDGSYSIPDFIGSGAPLTFKFTKPAESMGKSDIEITSPTDYDSSWDCYYLTNDEGDTLECEFTADGTTYTLYDPSVYYDSDTFIQWSETGAIKRGMDGKNYNYEYCLNLSADGYITSDPTAELTDNDFYYVWFEVYFNGIGEDEEVQSAENVTVYIDDYDGNVVANSFETTLVANADGSYTLNNVMSSDQPLSFKFTDKINDWADVEITSPLDTSVTYPYLMSADGKNYLFCTVYGFDGNAGAYEFTYPYIYLEGCAVYCYDPTDADNTYKYYASFCLNAFDADATKTVGWFYLEFFFGKNGTVKVNAVNADENAPVEYYNLNGMRVENPSNGIFIRKQGATAKKVVIK